MVLTPYFHTESTQEIFYANQLLALNQQFFTF